LIAEEKEEEKGEEEKEEEEGSGVTKGKKIKVDKEDEGAVGGKRGWKEVKKGEDDARSKSAGRCVSVYVCVCV
jgi:hypothetical protein